ncbi:zinc finger protein 90-like [Eurosta solidaginis]|uniref:zinc finger protein 90-like n=1 Tax=Eurosta solidaginis TaxID=178769 RepID=UPI0035310E6A
MRILRSQYMKYQAQQRLDAGTAATTTTPVTQLQSDTDIQHQQSTRTYLTRAADSQSVQTVTKTTHTVRRNSIFNNNVQATHYRRNSTVIYSDRPRSPTTITDNISSIALSTELDTNNCINVIAKPMFVQKRRQTVNCCAPDELIQNQVKNSLKIKLINAPTDKYSRINVVVRFYDEGPTWYTRFYHGYENVLWHKYERENPTKTNKWFFKCEVCAKKLGCFTSLKSHLNIHMKFFPYRCDLCPKKYPASKSFARHMKEKHNNKNKELIKSR